MPLHPLKFQPRYVEKIWGGRKIETVLGKSLPAGKQIGESWELYDFPPGVVDNSSGWISAVVSEGPLAGKTLHDLVKEFGKDLTGAVPLAGSQGQFPILIKFLDAREDLSVQVHPDQAYCDTHPGAHLKSEAWYVFQHDPGAKLYKGLQPGVKKDDLQKAIESGTVEQAIKTSPVKDGQCYYLPSGTIHALGAGMLVAEVQTPSDTTFRVFDFNRIDAATGKPRKLHVEEAMQCIDFSNASDAPQPRDHVGSLFTTVTRLVSSPYFTIEKVRFAEGVKEAVPYDQPVVWIMLDGEAEVSVRDVPQPIRFKRGETVLLPAKLNAPVLETKSPCVWLEVTFPITS
ncbi:MAG: class I mannose-6-phosphate isomerase [Phycisphaerae bacterium]|nr:class I mannose-6-phosphate isomerase [Phycisphaerae bacterium]